MVHSKVIKRAKEEQEEKQESERGQSEKGKDATKSRADGEL